jgi:PEP-CTERM motif
MKRLGWLAMVGLLLLGPPLWKVDEAAAFPVTSPLNCAFSGGVCGPTSSFGTLTFSDLGNDVQLVVDLAGTQNKILEVILNYDFEFLGSSLSVSGDASTLDVASNGVNADGCVGCFDIAVPSHGNIGTTDTATLVFHSAGHDLDISNFLFTNAAGVDAAVHIGNLGPNGCQASGCSPGTTGNGSAFAGEIPAVAEPGTLLLVGAGLLALGWIRRNTST